MTSYLLNKPVISFCLGAAAFASYTHLLNTTNFKDEECIIEVDSYGAIVCDVVKTTLSSFIGVFSSHDPPSTMDPSSTWDLACTLKSVDYDIDVKPSRWDVTEDTEALYLVRDVSGLNKKDVMEFVDFPSGDRRFFDYRMNIFGSVRVYRIMQYPPAILTIKHIGFEDPKNPYYGYTIKIDLPGRLFKTWDIKMTEENDVFKITIPKERGKWISKISFSKELVFFTYLLPINPSLF